ncbi:adiponectin receptor protein [Anaeramoeba flamelloides]|uniref:Adiponectin receptor protein n=1 Tax=Anaeramoeba flamelloides TaxID=1746091 RepID=A0ABQ8XIE5_9EUKA|nr:adiponectin receptor protein [Anaeramoeba flamelloides]
MALSLENWEVDASLNSKIEYKNQIQVFPIVDQQMKIKTTYSKIKNDLQLNKKHKLRINTKKNLNLEDRTNGLNKIDKDNVEQDNKQNPKLKENLIWNSKLKEYAQLPDWLKFNEFINGGYRLHFTIKDTLSSIFEIHNETINIWTHLLATMVFVYCIYYVFTVDYLRRASNVAKLNIVLYLLGGIVCFSSSTLFHTFEQHSKRFAALFLKIDLTGITLMIIGSTLPFIYFCLIVSPKVYYSYLAMDLLLGGFFIFSVWGNFKFINKMIGIRAVLFVILAMFCTVPVLRAYRLPTSIFSSYSLFRLSLMYGSYGIGLIFYLTKFPENLFRNKQIEKFGNSHQLWHFWIIIAAVVHFYSITFVCKRYYDLIDGPEFYPDSSFQGGI